MSKLSLPWRTYAESAALLSRVCVNVPSVGKYVIGSGDRMTRIGYSVSNTTKTEIDSFITFTGDPQAGRLPVSYIKAGIASVETEEMVEELEQNPGAKLAVGWTLGNAVLYGSIPNEEISLEMETFNFGMRVGRDILAVTAGLVFPEENQRFLPLRTVSRVADTAPIFTVHAGIPIY